MSDRPKFVEFREEGPREGFQIEKKVYPLADRVALVEALAETGLKYIQVASFVSPKHVPQMADSEQLFAAIRRRPGVHYAGLWLNEKGFERARRTPNVDLSAKLSLYASDAFAWKNNGCSAEEMRERQRRWMDLYAEAGLPIDNALVMAAFGCNYEGEIPPARVVELARWTDALCREYGQRLPRFFLADTMGWANPDSVRRLVGMVREALPEVRIGLHLHDTRGLGAANVLAALEMGVDLFDSSVAGLGGCPFASHGDATAAGNICTEDMVFLCHELGIETGIDLEALIECGRMAERIIGRKLSGHLIHSGSLAAYRRARPAKAAE
ncbi:hydroxymethylglutaryl-CoA lyase [Caldovatus sediminis]|uniref:Hydroxymethylglutaryl-CoA lyase n=1 Tax=Caldovatus sediminis TaxID=2041189 RepID=A0A8J2ZAE7_9PROT|nr:hydroxymethylglutaryl-CoA lyase [Caldovatus sediminis]GGG28405.1 hydroxymethylglutaryl-CoA lyase [Caldovatus sediminis]